MESNMKVSRAAGTVGVMTLFSRVLGFVRDTAIAMIFGSSAVTDAFFVAFRIPNMQRGLLGEGASNAAFIPVFSEYLNTRGAKEAWRLAGDFLNVLFVVLLVTVAGLIIFAPAIIALFAPGFLNNPEKFDLAVSLTRWMAPFLIFMGLGAFCSGILNAFKIFALPSASPILMNIAMVVAIFVVSPHMDVPIMGLALGVLAGGLLQLVVQLPAVFRKGFKYVFSLNWKHPGIIQIAKLLGPSVMGLAAYEVNIMVDMLLASLLPEGSISYLYYANRLVQLPLGVFGVALGVAILPTLSEQAARKDTHALIDTISFGIRLILFITVPASMGMILLRFPIVNTLWERGEFTRTATEGTAFALLCYAVGLCACAGVRVIVSAFYSLQDTKTPTKIGIYSIILNIALNLILMGPLKHGGIALATSLAAMFNMSTLIYILRGKLGRLDGRKILTSFFKLVIAVTGMSVAVYFPSLLFFDSHSALAVKLAVLTACIVSGIISFLLVSLLIKNEEMVFLKGFLQRKRAQKNLAG